MKNRTFLLAAALSAGLFLTACGQKAVSSTADYIGIDAAKESALKAADISKEQADFVSAGLDSKNGTFYYQVIFKENGMEHEYDIDALTGVVIEEKHTSLEEGDVRESQGMENESQAQGEREESTAVSESQMAANETASADNKTKSTGTQSQTASGGISKDKALAIALSHAGLTDGDISFSRVEEDVDDGRRVFDVEFITPDGKEFDYEIKAEDGAVISYDYDAESSFRQAPSSQNGIIPESQAKQAVLDRVPGAAAEQVLLWLEEDDGRMEYEGEFIYDNMEYEYKIDAYSGSIIEWEAESIRK